MSQILYKLLLVFHAFVAIIFACEGGWYAIGGTVSLCCLLKLWFINKEQTEEIAKWKNELQSL